MPHNRLTWGDGNLSIIIANDSGYQENTPSNKAVGLLSRCGVDIDRVIFATMGVNLLPSEQLLWTGSPVHHPVFDFGDLLLVPFSRLWFGVTVFWEVEAVETGAPVFVRVWGLLFVLVGVNLVAERLLVRWLTLRGTMYAVTDQRVVVISSVLGISQERSSYIANLEPPTLRESANGTGTIRFGSKSDYTRLLRNRRSGLMPQIELREIANVRFVRDTIVEGRARHR